MVHEASVTYHLRTGQSRDASDLTILIDAASRRLASWFWSTLSDPGQSYAEFGRTRILAKTTSQTYHSNWWVVEVDGMVAGALNGYYIPAPYDPGDISELPDVLLPIVELEEVAAGTWYVQVVSVFPEYRNSGLGRLLLRKAEDIAREHGADHVSILVETANGGAYRLYRSLGFADWATRPYRPFPGSDDAGDWVLLRKAVPEPGVEADAVTDL